MNTFKNENTKGDEEGEYIFTRKGVECTIVDYILGDGEAKEWVEEMKVGTRQIWITNQ